MMITRTAGTILTVIWKGWIDMDAHLDPCWDKDLSGAVMEVPCKDGGSYSFLPDGLCWSADGETLLLPLESERTEAGRGLIRAMWSGGEVALWAGGWRCQLRPYRCHIVGPVFTQCYLRAKSEDPSAEVAAVWELRADCVQAAEALAPAPLPLHRRGAQELHLDHPSLH